MQTPSPRIEVNDFGQAGDGFGELTTTIQAQQLLSGSTSYAHALLPPFTRDLENEQRSLTSRRKDSMIAVYSASQANLNDNHREGMSESTGPTDDSYSELNMQVKHPIIHESSFDEFGNFISSARELLGHLENFTHAVQRLGSALGLSRASLEFHRALKFVTEYFEENCRDLLGIVIKNLGDRNERPIKNSRVGRRRKKERMQYGGSLAWSHQNLLSTRLDELYSALKKFSVAVSDFDEYVDNEGAVALYAFMTEIKVLSEGLAYFGIDGDSQELRRFVGAKAMKLKGHLVGMTFVIKRFIDVGIPCISFAQKRTSATLNSAAAIATFFAGVSATTLQYSVALVDKPIEVAINTLWFSSLVLSIGSAVNALLAFTWRQAVYASPKQALPWYLRFWVRKGHLVLLVLSVVAFLAGVILFVWDTQKRIASWIVIAFSAFSAIGLINVSLWFGWERWTFSRFRNQQRIKMTPKEDSRLWDWIRYAYGRVFMRNQNDNFSEGYGSVLLSRQQRRTAPLQPSGSVLEQIKFGVKTVLGRFTINSWNGERGSQSHLQTRHHGSSQDEEGKRPVDLKRVTGHMMRSQSDPLARSAHRTTLEAERDAINEFARNLKDLKSRKICYGQSKVKHMQFSPCGRWLVVCFRLFCRVFDVHNNFQQSRLLKHRKKASQIEWAPKGYHLLTRYKDGVKLWKIDGENFVLSKEYKLVNGMNDIQWVNDDEFLALSNDANVLFRANLDGVVHGYSLPWDLKMYRMYSVPDSDSILFFASKGIEGLPEDKAIDCIIVYTMDASEPTSNYSRSSFSVNEPVWWSTKGRIERKIPLIDDVESLTVCPEHNFLLVSYESKPPEIWILSEGPTKISLTHSLAIPIAKQDEFDEDASWGDAHLVGPGRGVIACLSDNIMHFWSLENQQHLHCSPITSSDEEFDEYSVFSFNKSQENLKSPMMASTTKDGVVKVWTVTRTDKDSSIQEKDPEDVEEHIPLSNSPVQMFITPIDSDGGDGEEYPNGWVHQ